MLAVLLTGVGVESGIVEDFNQRPLCFAARGIHFEVASDEKLASHCVDRWWFEVEGWDYLCENLHGRCCYPARTRRNIG